MSKGALIGEHGLPLPASGYRMHTSRMTALRRPKNVNLINVLHSGAVLDFALPGVA